VPVVVNAQVLERDRDVKDVGVVAPSFAALLETFARDLEAGRHSAEREGDVIVELRRRP
jgi:cell wall assembly regulator SMI1